MEDANQIDIERLAEQVALVNNPDNDEDPEFIWEAVGAVLRAAPELMRQLEHTEAERDALKAENATLEEAEEAATREVGLVIADLRITEAERDDLAARVLTATELLRRAFYAGQGDYTWPDERDAFLEKT